MEITTKPFFFFFFFLHTWLYLLMTPALIMLVIPGLPSYNGVEVYYLKGVIGLPTVISFRDRWYIHIFFLEMGSLMTSSSSAGPIQISKFPEPWGQGSISLGVMSFGRFSKNLNAFCSITFMFVGLLRWNLYHTGALKKWYIHNSGLMYHVFRNQDQGSTQLVD